MKPHYLKTTLFAILDYLPSGLGFAVYHRLQRFVERDLGQTVAVNRKSLEKAKALLGKAGASFSGKHVIEIGSGWMPLMPYLFLAEGQARAVSTYDLNAHYSKRNLLRLNAFAKQEQWPLSESLLASNELSEIIQYFPKTNIISATLPATTDLVFSRFVLEHVTPSDLLAMHQKFAAELPKGTLVVHLISPSDHRAFSDSSLSHYDFLRYSEAEWAAIQTKFDYHNRLRLPQYLAIFEQSGLELLHVEYDTATPGTSKWEKFQKVPLHPDFQHYTPEELTAGSINVLLRVK